MGQSPSRHRPQNPLSLDPLLSSIHSSSTRIADPDDSLPTHTQQQPIPHIDSSHHNTDLHNQVPLPPKSSNRKSFLPTLRSPLRGRSNLQRTPHNQDEIDRSSKTHKRWTLYRRRKTAEPTRTLPDRQQPDEPQSGESSRAPILSPAPSSANATPDSKGKAKQDDPNASAIELTTTSSSPGPSSSDSSSSTTNVSQSDSVPFEGTATDVSSPHSSASPTSPSAPSSSSTPRDPVALNHDPAPPTIAIQPDGTPPEQSRDDSEAFNVMERPATPPDLSQPPPPEPRRNFPAAGTLVVVQGVVHTSDVSQTGNPEPSETAPRRASSVPPPGERPPRQRFSDMFSRPIRSRRSSYAAPESQSSETSASTESESQEESSPITETSLEPPAQEEPPVPASRPLSLSPTSIDVLGTLLREYLPFLLSVATAATAASLVSGSTDPLMTSGLALPSIQGSQQQSAPPPAFDQPRSQSPTQSRGQVQSRPLSPTPTAGLGPRDRVRHALAGLRDRFGLRPSTPTTAPVPLPAVSPPPEPEPIPSPSPSPTFPVDPRTQLLTDMARAFQMGMGLDDGTGSGSRSSGAPAPPPPAPPSSPPAIEVNLGDGQQRQQQQQRPPPPEDSFERFLLDLQVDLRRTLEEGQPENEPQPEREPQAEPVGVDVPPSIYPREAPSSTNDQSSANAVSDFGEELPALPPDDDDESLSYQDEADGGDDREPEEEAAPSTPSTEPPRPPPQAPSRRTVAGSEHRPGGINWWRMYRFPPMVVPHGMPATSPWPPSPSPPSSPSPAIPSAASAAAAAAGATQGERGAPAPPAADTQAPPSDGNTVVPVIVVGLQSVHGHGHGHGHRHTEGQGRDEPQQQQLEDQGHDNNHAQQQQQDDNPGDAAAESTRDRERERRWSARAAEAFRGLRPVPGSGPTRREGSGSSVNDGGARLGGDDGHGSTTFFIYVIGGYYPPNHQLVIGTDPLDSFEELAELLGHVKPQTATREDIDNSGLEVIRPGVLVEYEKSGRIAPMCVDRCLICLEDYNPEEDLRLLTCRHVFHKECVDRWLETGRNNCPACRSQGVSTGSGPIPMPPSP
ncbi:hypothetical protein BJV78DRAFT_1283231 [Lactifluus subvellereus]|nr:hypothetical protein BJV78DRAFT_1283231 [Lactifluus subvellereus]